MESVPLLSTKSSHLRPFIKIIPLSLLLISLALLYYYRVWGTVDSFVTAVDHCADLFCDFTKQYYPTGQNLFATATPTNGYFYSLTFAIFLSRLARFELATATQFWLLFQLATALLLLFFSTQSWAQAPRQQSTRAYLLYLLLLILAVPLLHNFKWGQLSTFLTACIMGTLYFYQRGQKGLAALVLVLATTVKYYPGLFLFYFLLKREWRLSLIYLSASFLLIIMLPLLLLGFDNNLHFYQFVGERIAHARSSWMLTDINSQYLASVAGRLLPEINGRLLWQLIGYGLTGGLLFLVYRLSRKEDKTAAPWAFSLLFLATPFFIETSWPHYFVYLPFCQLLIYLHLAQSKKSAAWYAIASLLTVAMIMPTAVFFNLWPDWKIYSRYGILFFANLLTLLSTLAILLNSPAQQLATAESPDPPQVDRH